MRELFQMLRERLEQGEKTVLATVISSSGSTPRGAGARMLVAEQGILCGTVGGGAVEYEAGIQAGRVLETGRSMVREYCLTRNQAADIGMVCGGTVEILFQYISPEDERTIGLLKKIQEAYERETDRWLLLDITDISKTGSWKMKLYGEEDREKICEGEADTGTAPPERIFRPSAARLELGGRDIYTEPLVRAETVYIFGGGHVAQELVPLLAHVGFSCVVMDDREEFASPSLFPAARKTIAGNMERLEDYLKITERDFVCIMTRGHQYDYYIQRQALAAKPAYIGVMGSRSKIKVVTEKLLKDGFSPEEIRRCHMPIGTAILAETPAEIAVSIAGELIRERAERRRMENG